MQHRPAAPPTFVTAGGGPPGSGRRWSVVVPAVVALLLVGAVGCTGDDSDAGSRTPSTEVHEAGQDAAEETATTADHGSGRPFNGARLVDVLLDPSEVGEGLERDLEDGVGAFTPQRCPDVAVDVYWQDQAAQGVVRAGDARTPVLTQAVLEFANTEASLAFIEDAIAAAMACHPIEQPVLVDGLGDRAFSFATEASGEVVLIRSGLYVTYLAAPGDPSADAAPVLTDQVLDRAVARLAG